VTLISVSDIGRDWRVRRHAELLCESGFEVCTVGLQSEDDQPWQTAHVEQPTWSTREKAEQALRLASVRVHPGRAESVYWSSPRHQALYAAAAGTGPADLFVANDWNTLPVASRLASEHGTKYAYDTHEYAVEEKAHRFRWRAVWPPFLHALEGRHIRGAVWVSTVSEGIATLLQQDHGLAVRPTVIRNVPTFQEMPFREPQEPMTVLFHGLLVDDRGLEQLLDSVPSWSERFRLVLRGKGSGTYIESLRERIASLGVESRVTIEDAVPPSRVVQAANSTADIGIHPMPAVTRHSQFGMPNKFFEYTMAGLALCVVAGTELSDVVEEYGNGVSLPSVDAQGIARTINALDGASTAAYKRKSLEAARQLSWEREQQRLASLYSEARA
jgi:glycosyltransferase involved in cell wall biosynthesis